MGARDVVCSAHVLGATFLLHCAAQGTHTLPSLRLAGLSAAVGGMGTRQMAEKFSEQLLPTRVKEPWAKQTDWRQSAKGCPDTMVLTRHRLLALV